MGQERCRLQPVLPDVWAQFRLMVVGDLLQRPPMVRGERRQRLAALAAQTWSHPQTGAPLRLGYSTISRWYDQARRARNPVAALRRQLRADRGGRRAVRAAFAGHLRDLYTEHPQWTVQLLHDNAVARSYQADETAIPSYASTLRYYNEQGWQRRRRLDGSGTDRALAAERRFVTREIEHYECSHIGALVHWDFHEGSRLVHDATQGPIKAYLLAFLDDRSRLVLHAQWYTEQTARVVAHSFMQSCAKHGIPRAVLNDNGAAMQAAEVEEGFDRLGVVHHFTQVYSPYQNGKMECFWAQVEGRLLDMLDQVERLDLALLNRLTAAWLHQEYYTRRHATTRMTPRQRWEQGPSVMRPAWTWAEMEQAFTRQVRRQVRRRVGTLSIDGVLYDVPPAYRHLPTVHVRVARWDVTRAWLCDPRSDAILSPLPLADPETRANAKRRRRPQQPASLTASAATTPPASGSGLPALPPLLQQHLAQHENGQPAPIMLADRKTTPPPATPSSDSVASSAGANPPGDISS